MIKRLTKKTKTQNFLHFLIKQTHQTKRERDYVFHCRGLYGWAFLCRRACKPWLWQSRRDWTCVGFWFRWWWRWVMVIRDLFNDLVHQRIRLAHMVCHGSLPHQRDSFLSLSLSLSHFPSLSLKNFYLFQGQLLLKFQESFEHEMTILHICCTVWLPRKWEKIEKKRNFFFI